MEALSSNHRLDKLLIPKLDMLHPGNFVLVEVEAQHIALLEVEVIQII